MQIVALSSELADMPWQYFVRTADDDVERYLKLFTFLPLDEIRLLMSQQWQNESKRLAQHMLAKEVVELAHGAADAKKAETAHKEAFSSGTNTFSLGALRTAMNTVDKLDSPTTPLTKMEKEILVYKQAYAAASTTEAISGTPKREDHNVVTIPLSMLQAGSFPRVLYAAGLATSKSEAQRLINSRGAYVVVPNSGLPETPTSLKWATIESGVAADPNHFLVDWEALIVRAGKSKIQICRVVTEEQFKAEGLTCPGWDDGSGASNRGSEEQ